MNVIFQDVLGPDFRVRSQYTEQPNVCQPSFHSSGESVITRLFTP